MRVRPFEEEDALAVDAVLDAAYAHEPRLRALHAAHGPSGEQPFRRSLVAEIEGGVAGVETIVRGERHPLRATLDIAVHPSNRPRRRIGAAAGAPRSGRAALRARGRLADEAGIAFLRRHGFELIARFWEGRFDPTTVAPVLPEPQPEEPPTLDEAAAFFERWYQGTHPWEPTTPWPLERARVVFCESEVVPGSLVGVRDDARLIGAANLIRPPGHDPGDELYLVWIKAEDDAPAAQLLARCVRFALEVGNAIRFEVEESNGPVWRVLDRLGALQEAVGSFGEPLTARSRGDSSRDSWAWSARTDWSNSN